MLCNNTLAAMAIHGQGRRFGGSRSNSRGKWPSADLLECAAQPFGGHPNAFGTDGQCNPEEALPCRTERAARQDDDTGLFQRVFCERAR
jgi:hypothetical protein